MNFQVIETFSNGNFNKLETFATETEASNFFSTILKEDGYKLPNMKRWDISLNKVTFNEDGDIEDIETIKNQTIYNEGTIDRKNYKGRNAVNYGFECVWNAEKQELEYTFYFQGKKEKETVLESDLQNWYY